MITDANMKVYSGITDSGNDIAHHGETDDGAPEDLSYLKSDDFLNRGVLADDSDDSSSTSNRSRHSPESYSAFPNNFFPRTPSPQPTNARTDNHANASVAVRPDRVSAASAYTSSASYNRNDPAGTFPNPHESFTGRGKRLGSAAPTSSTAPTAGLNTGTITHTGLGAHSAHGVTANDNARVVMGDSYAGRQNPNDNWSGTGAMSFEQHISYGSVPRFEPTGTHTKSSRKRPAPDSYPYSSGTAPTASRSGSQRRYGGRQYSQSHQPPIIPDEERITELSSSESEENDENTGRTIGDAGDKSAHRRSGYSAGTGRI